MVMRFVPVFRLMMMRVLPLATVVGAPFTVMKLEDGAKVTRAGLQNAASIAAMVLTTEALVADEPEPEPAMPAGAGGMGGMGGMM